MPLIKVVDVIEEAPPEEHEVPEVEIRGDEAVIRIDTPEGAEERTVKLPKTTWA
jgi:hypothetical protein